MMAAITDTRCDFPGCDHPQSPNSGRRNWCAGHMSQYYSRGRDVEAMTPLRPGKFLRAEEIASDIDEFEFLLRSGETVASAVRRCGLSASSLVVRYQRSGKPIPAGLWKLTSSRRDAEQIGTPR